MVIIPLLHAESRNRLRRNRETMAAPAETASNHRISVSGLGSRYSTITSAVLTLLSSVAATTSSIESPIATTPSFPIETPLVGVLLHE